MPRVRAAAILGLGSSERDLAPFQAGCDAEWIIGLPQNCEPLDAILIFGGDGTLHRHLRQLVASESPVLVVPRGSGNDFARALGFKNWRSSLRAWRAFLAGEKRPRPVDVGVITEVPSGKNAYFCCAAGVGLDGEIARRANTLPRWLRGHGGYALSFPRALARFVPFQLKLSSQDVNGHWNLHSHHTTIVAVFANTAYYGGGMKIAPRAQFDDGKLEVCLLTDIDKLKLFCLFPTVYFGRHLSVPQFEYFQHTKLRVETGRLLDVYADGEYVCQTPIEVSVKSRALEVIF
jgi:diacylglycerol kinase (ATP)